MPDEPVWGHFQRLSRENGIYSVDSWRLASDSGRVWPSARSLDWRKQVVRLMANSSERDGLLSYFEAHSIEPQLLPREAWDPRWLVLLNRWSFHYSGNYPAPLVIRSCAQCVCEDLAERGFSWFRLAHQLPGVDWCPRHSCSLNQIASGHSLLARDDFFNLRPPQRQSPAAPLPSFVQRYIRAIEWLRLPSNRDGWRAQLPVLKGSIAEEIERAKCGNAALITSSAPRDWYEANFAGEHLIETRLAMSSSPPISSPRMALIMAAIATSVEDVSHIASQLSQAIRNSSERSSTVGL